jgi:hypothetical protein
MNIPSVMLFSLLQIAVTKSSNLSFAGIISNVEDPAHDRMAESGMDFLG